VLILRILNPKPIRSGLQIPTSSGCRTKIDNLTNITGLIRICNPIFLFYTEHSKLHGKYNYQIYFSFGVYNAYETDTRFITASKKIPENTLSFPFFYKFVVIKKLITLHLF